jgi:hypothetical protein
LHRALCPAARTAATWARSILKSPGGRGAEATALRKLERPATCACAKTVGKQSELIDGSAGAKSELGLRPRDQRPAAACTLNNAALAPNAGLHSLFCGGCVRGTQVGEVPCPDERYQHHDRPREVGWLAPKANRGPVLLSEPVSPIEWAIATSSPFLRGVHNSGPNLARAR